MHFLFIAITMSLSDGTGNTPGNNSGGFSADQAEVVLALTSGVGATSVLVCVTGLVVAIVRKLCSRLPFRLASYQVAVALASGVVSGLEALFIRGGAAGGVGPLRGGDALCKALAYLLQCSHLAISTVTVCLTFHLLVFTVCRRNDACMWKLEAGYVVLSLALPLMASSVPFITGSYGPAGAWRCWIDPSKDDGIVLQLSLWYAPAALALIYQCASILLVVVVTVWRERAERKKKTLLVMIRPKRKVIRLVQIVPLLAYPTAWGFLIAPPVVAGIYGVIRKGYSGDPKDEWEYGLFLTDAFFTSAWNLTAGVILIAHVTIDACISTKAIATGRRRGDLGLSLTLSVESIDESNSVPTAQHSSSYQRYQNSMVAEVRTT